MQLMKTLPLTYGFCLIFASELFCPTQASPEVPSLVQGRQSKLGPGEKQGMTLTRDQNHASRIRRQSLNHFTTRKSL